MEVNTLDINRRDKTGKEAAKKLRREGFIPAVMYGYKGNKILSVKVAEFEELFEEIGEHVIISLNIDGKEKTDVIVKDFQLDPVKKNIIHVDFLEIKKGKALRTEIPIKIVGISTGVKRGGVLEEFIRDIEVECLPKDIPHLIEIDITDFDIGDSFHIKDIKVDDKIKLISNPEQVVLTIGTPTKIAEPVVEEVEVEEEVEAEGEAPAKEEEAE